MPDIIQDFDHESLKERLTEMGQPAFRAGQIFRQLHEGKRLSEMTDLPKALREKLSRAFIDQPVRIEKALVSKDRSVKFLYALRDGNIVEGVYMPHDYGNTVCVSTQVGCRMGCAFCASGLDGCVRDLTAGEILAQVAEVSRYAEKRVDNVVLMGSGEPLDNYENVTAFLRLVTHPDGLRVGQRNISLSTCGLCEGIRRLADDGFGVTLSVSLHATTDENRRKLMPVAKKYSIRETVDAAKYYFDKTGRRVVYEYALIKSNMTVFDARRLRELTHGYSAHVNLIMLNFVGERAIEGCSKPEAQRFLTRLRALGVSATLRRSMGSDVEGACGQLRRKHLDK